MWFNCRGLVVAAIALCGCTKMESDRYTIKQLTADGVLFVTSESGGLGVGGLTKREHFMLVAKLKGLDEVRCDSDDIAGGRLNVFRGLPLIELRIDGKLRQPEDIAVIKSLKQLKEIGCEPSECVSRTLELIGDCPSVRRLQLSYGHIADSDLQPLKKLTQLERLGLIGTDICNPVALVEMQSLRSLSLDDTRLSDAGLAAISRLGGLTELYVSETPITERGISSLAGMPELKILGICRLEQSGDPLSNLSKLPKIESLHIDGWMLSSSGIEALGRMKTLKTVFVYASEEQKRDKKQVLQQVLGDNVEVLWIGA